MIRFEKRKEIEYLQKKWLHKWINLNSDSIKANKDLEILRRGIKLLKRDLDK